MIPTYWFLVPALLIGLGILLLPWRPWSTEEWLDASPTVFPDLSDITVVIPARNEAGVITPALAGLKAQGTRLSVVLVDDESNDGTAEVARRSDLDQFTVIKGSPLPPGWSGKLWALEQGRIRVRTPLTLLLDADIVLAPGTLAALRDTLRRRQLQLVSLMAHLGMVNFWERLLLPAFVYFFKLMYPFRVSNSASRRIAAAAGGCVLIETAVLEEIGGFAALRDALIDDCTLAARVKATGGRTWIGLTHSARSLRRYRTLRTVWNMVARTAYTQLRYSLPLLLCCTAIMGVYFLIPPLLLLLAHGTLRWLAAGACALLAIPYLPTLRYYLLSPAWALLLPLVGALYLAMTWSSALHYYRGERSRWKGRAYLRQP